MLLFCVANLFVSFVCFVLACVFVCLFICLLVWCFYFACLFECVFVFVVDVVLCLYCFVCCNIKNKNIQKPTRARAFACLLISLTIFVPMLSASARAALQYQKT